MSRRFDWERATRAERFKPEFRPPPITPAAGMFSPATPAQLGYLHHLDPSIPEESLRALDRWEASIAIARLLRGGSS